MAGAPHPHCRVGDRLPVIMRGIGEAMSLDEHGRTSEAYMKYLSCAFYSIQSLNDDAAGKHIADISNEMSSKFFQLSQQCLDRARDLLNQHSPPGRKPEAPRTPPPPQHLAPPPSSAVGRPSSPSFGHPVFRQWSGGPPPSYEESQSQSITRNRSASDVPGGTSGKLDPGSLASMHPSKSLPPPGTTANMHSISPMDFATRQNQQLIAAYQRRIAKTRNKQQQSELILNFQRRLQENVAIAKRRQQTLLAKMREREKRQQETEKKTTRGVVLGSTEPEKLTQLAEEFSRKEGWVEGLLSKLRIDPKDAVIIQDLIGKILSSAQHPLALQLGTFQYNVYQQLLAVLKHSSSAFPTVKARPMVQKSTDSGSGSQSGPPSPEPGDLPRPSSGLDRLAQFKAFLMSEDSGGITVELKGGNTDKDEGDEDEIELSEDEDEKESHDSQLWGETQNLVKVITDSSAGSEEDSTAMKMLDNKSLDAAVTKVTIKVEEVELDAELSAIFTDIHNYLDELHGGFLMCYPILNSPEGKEQCLALIEQYFFPPIWPPLLNVLRHIKQKTEVKVTDAMSSLYHALPKDLSVAKQLWLMDEGEDCLAEAEESQPYSEPIRHIKALVDKKSPLEKLECVGAAFRGIVECVDQYWVSKGKAKERSLGTDDLLPVLIYVVIKSRLPQLVSECTAIEEFVHEQYLMGEEGYCLTSLNTALAYVASLGKDT